MSINFSRNTSQLLYESFIGASSTEELMEKKDAFENHALSLAEVMQLKESLKVDALNFFYNGILSFSEGIDAAYQKRFSWATVELYYSIYYLIRASLAVKGTVLLRCRSMYRLSVKVGEKPYKTGNKKYNTTHEGTISHYKDIYGVEDLLLSNNIDDIDAYQWMMNVREIVNYRSAAFPEPNCLEIWDYYLTCIEDGTFASALEQLENDPYVMCFQEEYAVLAIPMKRLQQTISDLANGGLLSGFNNERMNFTKAVIGYDERKLKILDQIFGD